MNMLLANMSVKWGKQSFRCFSNVPSVASNFSLNQTSFSILPTMMELPPVTTQNDIMEAVKRSYQPSVLRRKRKHGFLNRLETVGGRRILKNRRKKNRSRMSA